MFNFNDDDLLIENNEIKPNRFAAKALIVGMIALAICLFLNEIGVFQITDKVMMRIACGVAMFTCAAPQFFVYNDKIAGKYWFKYIMLICVCALTFIMELSLFIFTAPMCLLPLLLAAQYNSKKFSTLAIVGTILIILISVPVGCIAGFWQPDFFSFLLKYSLGFEGDYDEAAALKDTVSVSTWRMVWRLTLYISFPWLLCTILSSTIIQLMTKKGSENVKSQLEIRRFSRMDTLTGLYNSNTYRSFLKQDLGEGTIGVLFFDVDGLKRVNDKYGHEFGDMLLGACAGSLTPLFDDKCCGFRIGGDEFIVFVDTSDPAVVDEKRSQWEENLSRLDFGNGPDGVKIEYHMSVGVAFGDRRDIVEIVAKADKEMYKKKRARKASLKQEN